MLITYQVVRLFSVLINNECLSKKRHQHQPTLEQNSGLAITGMKNKSNLEKHISQNRVHRGSSVAYLMRSYRK